LKSLFEKGAVDSKTFLSTANVTARNIRTSPLRKKLTDEKPGNLRRSSRVTISSIAAPMSDILSGADAPSQSKILCNFVKSIENIDPEVQRSILYAINSLESIRAFFAEVKSRGGKRSENIAMIETVLGALNFENPTDIETHQVAKLLGVTDYLVKMNLPLVESFKSGQSTNLKKLRNSHSLFSSMTKHYARQYYIDNCEGHARAIVATRRKRKGEIKQQRAVQVLPCRIGEFYELFKMEYGNRCRDWKGEPRIPGVDWFIQQMPWWVRPKDSSQLSGYCKTCLMVELFLRAFARMMRKACECGKQSCPYFVHEDGCEHEGDEQPNDDCWCQCHCDLCDSCGICKLNSFRGFVSVLKCTGAKMGDREFCKLKCIDNECTKCHLKSIEDLICICPTATETIDFDNDFSFKAYEHVEDEDGKGKKFQVPVIVEKETSVREFLKLFLETIKGNGKKAWLPHYHKKCFQRMAYNQLQNVIRSGIRQDLGLATIDNGESLKCEMQKKTSDAHYK
jgi:hypothetical protein